MQIRERIPLILRAYTLEIDKQTLLSSGARKKNPLSTHSRLIQRWADEMAIRAKSTLILNRWSQIHCNNKT